MRNPERIKRMLDMIERIWVKNPDLRLMQLLGNALPPGDCYYIEDYVLEHSLRHAYKESL